MDEASVVLKAGESEDKGRHKPYNFLRLSFAFSFTFRLRMPVLPGPGYDVRNNVALSASTSTDYSSTYMSAVCVLITHSNSDGIHLISLSNHI
jgi:hypothetical protein